MRSPTAILLVRQSNSCTWGLICRNCIQRLPKQRHKLQNEMKTKEQEGNRTQDLIKYARDVTAKPNRQDVTGKPDRQESENASGVRGCQFTKPFDLLTLKT